MLREIGGAECPTCPWRAFSDPVVRDVIELVKTVGADGSPAVLIPDDPPHHLWEGVLLWRDVWARTRERYREQDAEEDRRKRG